MHYILTPVFASMQSCLSERWMIKHVFHEYSPGFEPKTNCIPMASPIGTSWYLATIGDIGSIGAALPATGLSGNGGCKGIIDGMTTPELVAIGDFGSPLRPD